MPIKIVKKRHVEQARPPAPLIDPTPPSKGKAKQAPTEPKPAPSPKPQANPQPAKQLRLATSLTDYWDNRNSVYLPEFRACKKCGHSYPFPCDGKSKTCMNIPIAGRV